MREPPVGDKLLYRQSLRRAALLRQNGTHAREFFFRVAPQLFAAEQDLSGIACIQPRESAQERRFPRSVGADDGGAPPRCDRDIQPVQDLFAANFDAQVLRRNPRTHSCLLRRYRKNGAPSAAMMMPTGSSIGEKSRRAAVSLSVSVVTPSSAAAGRRNR